jgi:hypothetical protein
MIRIALVAITVALTGCASMALRYGDLHINPSPVPGAVYRVDMLNVADLGFDGDNPADRQRYALQLLTSESCVHPVMVDEQKLQLGYWPFGTPRISYVSDWRCG